VIRAVLIDLDGVVRRWAPWEPEEALGVTRDDVTAVAFDEDVLQNVVTGGVTDEQWREEVAVRLEAAHGPAGRRAMEGWSAPIGEVDADVLAIVQALREVVPVALVSNATSRLESDLDQLGIADAFDLIVNSSRIGFAKPDERIFRHAAGQLDVSLDECLFIDDTLRHVEGASRLGLRTIHFTGAADLRRAVVEFGLLPPDRPGPRLELLIRRAHRDEAHEIAELHSRTAMHAYAHIFPSEAPPPTIDDHRRDWTEALRERTAYVAVVDNAIVGVVLSGPDVREPGAGHLSRLYVAPELSGRGIGTRLYQACLRELAELGFTQATLWVLERNERVREWYERLGWKVTGERKPVYEPAAIDDLRYRLTSF
jgi:putative hydrolase of the HAD superfamily